jgi:hypothetical protein
VGAAPGTRSSAQRPSATATVLLTVVTVLIPVVLVAGYLMVRAARRRRYGASDDQVLPLLFLGPVALVHLPPHEQRTAPAALLRLAYHRCSGACSGGTSKSTVVSATPPLFWRHNPCSSDTPATTHKESCSCDTPATAISPSFLRHHTRSTDTPATATPPLPPPPCGASVMPLQLLELLPLLLPNCSCYAVMLRVPHSMA